MNNVSDGRTEGNRRASIPRPAVPDWCSHCQNYEDEENSKSQPAHNRTLQSAQVSSQGQ